MSDQLEARLREHIGATIELLADRLNPDWQQSDTLTLAVMNCADGASGPVAHELARLRERERRLEGALDDLALEHEHQAEVWRDEADDLTASEPEREPWDMAAQIAEQMEPGPYTSAEQHGRDIAKHIRRTASKRAARTPEPAGDSELTDVRELPSLLAMLETAADPSHAAMMSPYAVAGMAQRAAAALERLEALEQMRDGIIQIRQDWREGAYTGDHAMGHVSQELSALATPAPAPQGGEG